MGSPLRSTIGLEACKLPIKYDLADFGISTGVLPKNPDNPNSSRKLHIFVGMQTADFLLTIMNRQVGLPRIYDGLIYEKGTHPADPQQGFAEDSRIAELKRGRRIYQALNDERAVRGAEDVATFLGKQMLVEAEVITPHLLNDNRIPDTTKFTIKQNPENVWLDKSSYSAICSHGISLVTGIIDISRR